MRPRPQYLHNETQAFIPVDGRGKPVELVYNGRMDVLWHPNGKEAVHRRYLLQAFRAWTRRDRGDSIDTYFEPQPQEAIIMTIGDVFFDVRHCRPILQICADMRRHVPRQARSR